MDKLLLQKRMIIRELYYSANASCSYLSGKIGKSLPLTMKIITEMIAEGTVIETGFAPSSGGRRPLTYTLAHDLFYVVSIAMDQFITRIAIMDMLNRPVTTIVKFELALVDNPLALSTLVPEIEKIIKASGVDRKKIVGVGIGMPGFIDNKKGINHSFSMVEGSNKNIPEYLYEKLGLPVYIDNDSSLVALAELCFGASRNRKNTMVLNLGWGVGLGMVLDGQLFRGNNGLAGEFSHIPLFNNNKLCKCGKSGCLETEVSLLVLIDKVKEGLAAGRKSNIAAEFPSGDPEVDCENILKAAFNGDKFAIELLSDIGYHIGRGIAILIHLFNPGYIILSGRGSIGGKLWLAPVQQALNEHCIPKLAANTEIEISALGYQAELIGSAALVIENFTKQTSRTAVSRKRANVSA
jgi:predicted NBD/HSP70 family sugar kinase